MLSVRHACTHIHRHRNPLLHSLTAHVLFLLLFGRQWETKKETHLSNADDDSTLHVRFHRNPVPNELCVHIDVQTVSISKCLFVVITYFCMWFSGIMCIHRFNENILCFIWGFSCAISILGACELSCAIRNQISDEIEVKWVSECVCSSKRETKDKISLFYSLHTQFVFLVFSCYFFPSLVVVLDEILCRCRCRNKTTSNANEFAWT